MLLKSIVFIFILTAYFTGYAIDPLLGLKFGSWSFQTKNIGNSEKSFTGLGAYSLNLNIQVANHWSMEGSFNYLMSDIVSGGQGFGFDMGIKYFPLTQSSPIHSETDCCQMSMKDLYRPYLGTFLTQRTFNLNLTTTFIGTAFYVGLDYQLGEQWLVNFETRYSFYYGPDQAQATQINFFLGIGFMY